MKVTIYEHPDNNRVQAYFSSEAIKALGTTESHFFMFKVYLKGTMHLKFKDKKIWETLNRAYAKAKGQTLPEKL